MSYIRGATVYRYVDGVSSDYIFPTCDSIPPDGEPDLADVYIEDYGKISNETLYEFFAALLNEGKYKDDVVFKDYLLDKLREKLNVKCRKVPLTKDEAWDQQFKNFEEWKKTNEYKMFLPEAGETNDAPNKE